MHAASVILAVFLGAFNHLHVHSIPPPSLLSNMAAAAAAMLSSPVPNKLVCGRYMYKLKLFGCVWPSTFVADFSVCMYPLTIIAYSGNVHVQVQVLYIVHVHA